MRESRLVISELHTAGSGHRLRIDALYGEKPCVVVQSMGGGGYVFAGKAPIELYAAFHVSATRLARQPHLFQMAYTSGRPIRTGLRTVCVNHLNPILQSFIDRRPEVFETPSAHLIRGVLQESLTVLDIETAIGGLQASLRHGAVVIERLAISGDRKLLQGNREILGVFPLDTGVPGRVRVWSTNEFGIRLPVEPSREEAHVLGALSRRLQVNAGLIRSVADLVEALEGVDLLAPVPQVPKCVDLPSMLRSRFEVEQTEELVDNLNRVRARAGRPPLASGSIPTSMEKLRSFLRIYDREVLSA